MNIFNWRHCFMAMVLGAGVLTASAQTVIFPGITQPGVAAVSETDGVYTLSNDLLSASFISDGTTLKFNGCEAMNLKPGTELFVITLGDGTKVNASDMTMQSVSTEVLTANPASPKGAERFNGHAIVADFTGSGLDIEWRAVLRDGSHYLRTEMAITPTDGDVAMNSILALNYDVQNVEGHTTPMVVGNTRGAMIASNNIFAGAETPMAFNTVVSAATGMEGFTPEAWTPESFQAVPGLNVPESILALKTLADNASIEFDQVVVASGFLTFREPGEQKITFQYTNGSHRLNLVGVDVCDPVSGEVISSDYHVGFTGGQKRDNVYTVNIDNAGSYLVRYFVETRTETITSSGTVSYNKKIAIPTVIIGQDPNANKIRRVLSETDASTLDVGDTETDTWTGSSWIRTGADNVCARIEELGVNINDVRHMERRIAFAEPGGTLSVEFLYTKGNHRIDICGVELLDAQGNIVTSDYHKGYSGTNKSENIYTIKVPNATEYKIRYYISNADNAMNTNGNINLTFTKEYFVYIPAPDSQEIQGLWQRKTTLAAGKTWKVGSVVGLVGANQQRRSVGCYIDRERAVAWRPFPIYNSWFELNIDRKDDPTYKTHFTEAQCIDVIRQWKTNLYEAYGANVKAFVWDDGWDEWGPWTFNFNFPNGLTEIDKVANNMNAGQGIWIGPVGGYGTSGNSRRSYWSNKGGMQLSNPAYYECFMNTCNHFITNYNHRYFKFDGISDLFAAYGPKPGNEEGAEGIIDIEQRVREMKPDIYLNTSVGTWASPFWYFISDAIWRQENDFGVTGNNSINRENWITYRDRLIHQNYVVGSPLCPINSIMSHGFILTAFGGPKNYSRDYNAALREMRCAFASGASMVELYCDYSLMNSIVGEGKQGKLWEDMAECIFWQEKNADVLADIHWVGGNPWTGSDAQVYGWASWNGTKSTLVLRNGSNSQKTFVSTLREMLEIPEHITGAIRLKHSFNVQTPIEGIELDKPIDIDKRLTFKLPSSSLVCYDGIDAEKPWPAEPGQSEIETITVKNAPIADDVIYDLQGRRAAANPLPGLYIKNGHLIRL